MVFYFDYNNYKWLVKSIEINLFKTIRFYITNLIQKIELYLLSINEELLFLYYIKKQKNKNIAFWGASLYLERFLTKYNINNKNIVGIIDKDSKKWGQKLCL